MASVADYQFDGPRLASAVQPGGQVLRQQPRRGHRLLVEMPFVVPAIKPRGCVHRGNGGQEGTQSLYISRAMRARSR